MNVPLNCMTFYLKTTLRRIKNTLQPDWTKTFFLDYELGTPVSVLIKIFDEVIEMGSAIFDLGSILGAKGNTKGKELKRGGTIYVRAQ